MKKVIIVIKACFILFYVPLRCSPFSQYPCLFDIRLALFYLALHSQKRLVLDILLSYASVNSSCPNPRWLQRGICPPYQSPLFHSVYEKL